MSQPFMEVLDPRGVPVSDENELAERPVSLNEVRLGILSNSKPNGDLLLNTVQQALEDRFHFTEVVYRNKNTSSPAPPDVMADLAQCDVVVNAIGDWGSCTSWSIHDAIELEKRGIPTATICSTEFIALGRAEADAFGLSQLPIATIEHPLGGLKAEAVRDRAVSVVVTIEQLLTTPRQQLMTTFWSRMAEALYHKSLPITVSFVIGPTRLGEAIAAHNTGLCMGSELMLTMTDSGWDVITIDRGEGVAWREIFLCSLTSYGYLLL